jgi:hypothetical protein
MDKYKMIPVYFLEKLVRSMEEQNPKTMTIQCAILSTKCLIKDGKDVPTELCPDVTRRDIVEELYPDGYSGIDFALPQNLVNTVQEKMGFNMCPHFVMDCRGNYKLIPITSIGRTMLPIIYKVCLNSEVPE